MRKFTALLRDAIEHAHVDSDLTASDAGLLLMDMRDAKRELGDAFGLLEWHAHNLMKSEGHYTLDIEGVGRFQRQNGGRTHWHDDQVMQRLLKAARDPDQRLKTSDGEIERTDEALARLVLVAGAVNYWRKGALEALGAYDEEMRWKEPGTPGVQLPPRRT